MNRFYSIIFILSMLAFPFSGSGEEKPSITVNFNIKEKTYIDFFGDEKIKWIETEARNKINDILSNYFSFLEFTDIEKEDKLIINLEPKEKLTPVKKLTEVIFRLTVEGPNVSNNIESIFWTFRPLEEYNLPISEEKEGFLNKIIIRFENFFENRDFLVDHLFSKIIIAREAQHLPNSLYLDMPFNLGIGQESKFKLQADIRSNINRSIYCKADHYGLNTEGMIRAKIKEPKDEIEEIIEEMKCYQVEIIIKRIYLIFYKPAKKPTIQPKKPGGSTSDEEREV